MKSCNEIRNDCKANSSWKDYFSDNFVSNILYRKKTIVRQNIKRSFIAVAVTWIICALVFLPVIFTGKNWSGQEIDISSKFIAGGILLAILVSIFQIIGFNYFLSSKEYAEDVEMLIMEELQSQGNIDDMNYVIGNFEMSEKVSPKIGSKRYLITVFGFFGISCVLIIIFLFLFQ